MEIVTISKNRVRDYLAERLARRVLQTDVNDLILVLRFTPLGGLEFLSDEDLLEQLISVHPELSLMTIAGSSDDILQISVRSENAADEADILVDVKRIFQVIY
ncbi:MAG: hypothetical protein JW783_10725 [Bacteroidales bacterium]|nr:hypothetical protein [Bacteroidales bacterium]MBN2750246.1 hypothetical protein [Bacteroidales bacterium]